MRFDLKFSHHWSVHHCTLCHRPVAQRLPTRDSRELEKLSSLSSDVD